MHDEEIKQMMNSFFENPHNRLIMAMFAVHDGEMSVKEAIDFSKRLK